MVPTLTAEISKLVRPKTNPAAAGVDVAMAVVVEGEDTGTGAVAAVVGSFAAGSHFLFLPVGGFRTNGRRSCRADVAGVNERTVRDRRKGRRFEELMGSEDFGRAWMDYLKVFFSDWELTTAEVCT
jgi:hypothetical protein